MKESLRLEMEVNPHIEEDARKNGWFAMEIEEGHIPKMSKEFLIN